MSKDLWKNQFWNKADAKHTLLQWKLDNIQETTWKVFREIISFVALFCRAVRQFWSNLEIVCLIVYWIRFRKG